MPKKPKRNGLQEAYEAFLASQPKVEQVQQLPAPVPSPYPTRDLQHLIPGCWVKLVCPSPVPGYPSQYYSAQVERVTENSIIFVSELTTSIGRSQFIGEFERNPRYSICSPEEKEQILRSREALERLNCQLCADSLAKNLSGIGGGGMGFAGVNNHRSSSSDSSSSDQDGFLSPGYD